jgi:starch phosphorylase
MLAVRFLTTMRSGQTSDFGFNTHRMVKEYCERFYLAAHTRELELLDNNAAPAKELGDWLERVRAAWPDVSVVSVQNGVPESLVVNTSLTTKARVRLGSLTPGDVSVELFMGPLNARGEIVDPVTHSMEPTGCNEDGAYEFEASATSSTRSGLNGYTIRVLPYHRDLPRAFVPGLIRWADGNK